MSRDQQATFQPVAMIMALVLPGLGHAWLGDWKRGMLVFAGIMGLFLGGMLIGGIDVIDRKEDKWWFVLQGGVGPVAFAVDAVHQNSFKVPDRLGTRITPPPSQDQGAGGTGGWRAKKSLGRVNEVGSLFAAMGGMLNMIAIIDAAWRAPKPKERRQA